MDCQLGIRADRPLQEMGRYLCEVTDSQIMSLIHVNRFELLATDLRSHETCGLLFPQPLWNWFAHTSYIL